MAGLYPFQAVMGLFVSVAIILTLIPLARQTGHPLLYYFIISGTLGLFYQVANYANYANNNPLGQIFPQANEEIVRIQFGHGNVPARFAKDAVEAYFRETGLPPANRTEAGLPADTSYKENSFVDSVEIVQGAVIITFSDQAVRQLAGKSLVMTPYESEQMYPHVVLWRCGRARFRSGEGYVLMGTTAGLPAIQLNTTIADPDLPPRCRSR